MEQVPTSDKPEVHRFDYDGTAGEMFLLMLQNYLLTIITFGIYNFWARTRTRKYIWSHVKFMGDRLEYTGTGRELWISAAKVFGIFFVVVVTMGFVGRLGTLFVVLANLLFYLGFFLLVGFAQYSGRNYRLSRTRWRGVRLGMTPGRLEYLKTYVIWSLLTVLSLGILAPQRWVKLRSILVGNTKFGSERWRYTGEASEVILPYIKGILLTFFTFGIYYSWHLAWKISYDMRNSHFSGARLKFIGTGGEILTLYIESFLIVLFTLGLGTPFVINRGLRYFSSRVAFVGPIDLDAIGPSQQQESAMGEELGDFLDVDFAF